MPCTHLFKCLVFLVTIGTACYWARTLFTLEWQVSNLVLNLLFSNLPFIIATFSVLGYSGCSVGLCNNRIGEHRTILGYAFPILSVARVGASALQTPSATLIDSVDYRWL